MLPPFIYKFFLKKNITLGASKNFPIFLLLFFSPLPPIYVGLKLAFLSSYSIKHGSVVHHRHLSLYLSTPQIPPFQQCL